MIAGENYVNEVDEHFKKKPFGDMCCEERWLGTDSFKKSLSIYYYPVSQFLQKV